MAASEGGTRRGPKPRHSRAEVIAAAVAIADEAGLDAVTIRSVASRLAAGPMSLYSYVPDKQALVSDMVEHVSGELEIPAAPSGDWRADLRLLAGRQRALLHRHPWLTTAVTHRQPLGPAMLAYLEFNLAALEPTGLSAAARLELTALLNGLVMSLTRAELADAAAPPDPAAAAAEQARLGELLGTGRYPRLAAAFAAGGPAGMDLTENFGRLFDRVLEGLTGTAG